MSLGLYQNAVSCLPRIVWHKLTSEHKVNYELKLKELLSNSVFKCLESTNINDIEIIYSIIITTISEASLSTLPSTKFNKYAKPYWNQDVNASHKTQ